MLVWGIIYCVWQDIPLIQAVKDVYKAGYWFTFTLFEFYIIQMVVELISRQLGLVEKEIMYILLGLGVSIICYLFLILSAKNMLGAWTGILGLTQLRYYFFFWLGRVVALHYDKFIKWKYKEQMMTSTTFLFIGLVVCFYIADIQFKGLWFHTIWILFQAISVFLLFCFFYRKRNFFSGGQKLAKAMCYIGQRTLDIYLLHYFFLPKDLHLFGSYFVLHEAILVEALFAGIVTLAIVMVCIACGELLRSSKLIGNWLLGGK